MTKWIVGLFAWIFSSKKECGGSQKTVEAKIKNAKFLLGSLEQHLWRSGLELYGFLDYFGDPSGRIHCTWGIREIYSEREIGKVWSEYFSPPDEDVVYWDILPALSVKIEIIDYRYEPFLAVLAGKLQVETGLPIRTFYLSNW